MRVANGRIYEDEEDYRADATYRDQQSDVLYDLQRQALEIWRAVEKLKEEYDV